VFNTAENINIALNNKKNYYKEMELLKNITLSNFERNVIRFAIYEFINKFRLPCNEIDTQAYGMWMRFLYNIMTNSDLGGRSEDACEAMVFFHNIIKNIRSDTEKGVLEAIIKASGKVPAALRYQYVDENIKSRLVLESDRWKDAIINAEEFFVNGQIGFLLEFCLGKDGYDLDKFYFYFSAICKFLDSKRTVVSSCDNSKLKQAMLCMNDTTINFTSFLEKQSNSTTTWGFYGSNYSDLISNRTDSTKKLIVKELLDSINIDNDINKSLMELIEKVDLNSFVGKNAWKKIFIQNNLFNINMGPYRFQNCIHLADANRNVLLLAGTTARAYSMEPNTYLLYSIL
jgi:hypothetical protein